MKLNKKLVLRKRIALEVWLKGKGLYRTTPSGIAQSGVGRRYYSIFLAFLLIALCTASAFSQESLLRVGEGWVHGKVVDKSDAMFSRAEITFKNKRITKVAIADNNGEFRVGLPQGIYSIYFKRGLSKPKYERANIAIPTAGDRELIIVILPWCYSLGCPKDAHRFAKFGQGWTQQRSLNINIAYNAKNKSRAGTVYRNALFTYDTYTVFGDQIVQNFKTKTLSVTGNGWIEDGTGRRNFVSLTVSFDKSGIKIDEH